ncbi:MAG: hypothetical protein GY862_04560 [Gammaproteobacteria bacterium]|nr:hypothetical protein [Gammaproteobacteria bacterium]
MEFFVNLAAAGQETRRKNSTAGELIMGLRELDSFLTDTAKEQSELVQDYQKDKNEWLAYIQSFYDQILVWLSPLIERNKIKYEYKPIKINEEYLGDYEANALSLRLASQEVVLEPIGGIIIGVKGRIDMRGSQGTVKLLLVDKRAKDARAKTAASEWPRNKQVRKESAARTELVWKIGTPPPSIEFLELDENVFSDALLEVVNG